MTTKEIFSEMQKRTDANPAKLAGLKGVFQFDLSGIDPGIYSVTIADGRPLSVRGPPLPPISRLAWPPTTLRTWLRAGWTPSQPSWEGSLK